MSHDPTYRVNRKPYMHARDVFHSAAVDGAEFCGRFDMPSLPAVQEAPIGLIPFSVAISPRCHDYHCYVHFYEDDYRFERLWNSPERYLPKLLKFAGAISPDFSTCVDFPGALKVWNTYIEALVNDRSALIGTDRYGKSWYARINVDGSQMWASTRDGVVRNCGINETPNPWDPETGLSRNLPKRPSKRRKQ